MLGRVPWQEAVQEAPVGCRLLLETAPAAQDSRFPTGFDPWRKRIGIRVRSPARGGRANEEVVSTIAAFFGVRADQVRLRAGARGSHKTVEVGLPRPEALRRLAAALEGP